MEHLFSTQIKYTFCVSSHKLELYEMENKHLKEMNIQLKNTNRQLIENIQDLRSNKSTIKNKYTDSISESKISKKKYNIVTRNSLIY